MVKYIGKYCSAWQYMPKKPIKWGLKVWVMVDATSHIISDFEVYCGKSTTNLVGGMSQRVEQNLAHRVVMDLTAGLDNKGHVITMDNFFTSVGLFHDLEHRGIYAIGTMHSNRIGLHPDMRKIKEFRRQGQRDLEWFMHNSRKMCTVLWKSCTTNYAEKPAGLHGSPSGWCKKGQHSYIPCASGIHQEHEGGGCCRSHSRELYLPSTDS
jgi:hypothetical protein